MPSRRSLSQVSRSAMFSARPAISHHPLCIYAEASRPVDVWAESEGLERPSTFVVVPSSRERLCGDV